MEGVRIVTHAFFLLALSSETKRLSLPDPQALRLWSQPITNALPLHLRWQFTDCHQLQMLRQCLASERTTPSYQSAAHLNTLKMHTERWSKEGNEWGVAGAITCGEWRDTAPNLNRFGCGFKQNTPLERTPRHGISCKSPSCPLTCRQLRGERSQRFSPGLQLSWLHTTLNNRLNAGLKLL